MPRNRPINYSPTAPHPKRAGREAAYWAALCGCLCLAYAVAYPAIALRSGLEQLENIHTALPYSLAIVPPIFTLAWNIWLACTASWERTNSKELLQITIGITGTLIAGITGVLLIRIVLHFPFP